ncbi:MAG: hypothetical protein E7173_01965 [Firmicutes bacterium]|nr:hypothetical protein [Bacillota bacterium]
MKRTNITFILFIILGIFIFPNTISAACKTAIATITSNKYSTSVGSQITVSIKTQNISGVLDVTSSDSSIFTGGGRIVVNSSNPNKTVTFTAKKAGTVSIILKPTDVSIYGDGCESYYTTNKSINVTSYVPRALASDNYLSSLSVDGVELAPSFDKDTDSYIVDLEPGTTSISINAEKANKYASVSGTGKFSVQEGNNELDVVVTAENGSKRTYHITAVVKEYDPINVKIGNSEYTVVRKLSELTKPEHYENTTAEIDGNNIPGFYNEKTGYTLVGLKDVTGVVKLYIYNKQTYKPYLSLEFNKMNLVILEANSENLPKGFMQDEITINNEKVTCYTNQELGITLLFGKSLVTGETSFYEFENSDFTVQKFNLSAYDKLNGVIDMYSYIILGLGGLTLLILLCLIISIVNNKRKLKYKQTEIEKTMNIDINQIEKTTKKDKKLEKLRKQKEMKKTEKHKKNNSEEDKEDDMFYL